MAERSCNECEFVGVMIQPPQTLDMPMVYECPECRAVSDHPLVEGHD